MKIRAIEYQRVHNLGHYESERLTASADVDDREDPAQVFEQLKQWVCTRLGLSVGDDGEGY